MKKPFYIGMVVLLSWFAIFNSTNIPASAQGGQTFWDAKYSQKHDSRPIMPMSGAMLDPLRPVFWKPLNVPNPQSVYDIAIDPKNPAHILLGTADSSHPVMYSNDFGQSWSIQTTGLPDSNGQRLAFDPISPNIVYVGLRLFEGIYRSDDGGLSWTAKNAGITQLPAEIGDLIVHPISPTLVLAAESNALHIYRSEDRGESWTTIPLSPETRTFSRFLFDPVDPSKIYAITSYEVYISTDAGLTWENSGIIAHSYAIHPSSPNIHYKLQQNNLYKSEDGGIAWDLIHKTDPYIYEFIYIDPFDGNVLYLTSQYRNVTRSVDGGKSWSVLDKGVDGEPAPNSWTFAIDPVDSSRLYVYGYNIYRWDVFISTYGQNIFLPIVLR